jgi:hypothetical protein
VRLSLHLVAESQLSASRVAALQQHRTTPASARRPRPAHLSPEVHLMPNNLLRAHV